MTLPDLQITLGGSLPVRVFLHLRHDSDKGPVAGPWMGIWDQFPLFPGLSTATRQHALVEAEKRWSKGKKTTEELNEVPQYARVGESHV